MMALTIAAHLKKQQAILYVLTTPFASYSLHHIVPNIKLFHKHVVS